jgi:hypothetical protein
MVLGIVDDVIKDFTSLRRFEIFFFGWITAFLLFVLLLFLLFRLFSPG